MRYVGIGPAIAATAIGDVRDISRPSRNHFAAYNATAPTEVPAGNRVIYRLSLRGNRRLNHASMPHGAARRAADKPCGQQRKRGERRRSETRPEFLQQLPQQAR